MQPNQYVDLPNGFNPVRRPKPPEIVLAVEGCKPWDRNKESLRDYAFNCGVKSGLFVGLLIGWTAGGAFVAWLMR